MSKRFHGLLTEFQFLQVDILEPQRCVVVLKKNRTSRPTKVCLVLVEHQLVVQLHGNQPFFHPNFKVVPLADWAIGVV